MGVSFKGYENIAKLLIDHNANVNVKNYNGATALIYATMFKKIPILNLLLNNGADTSIKDDSGRTALDHAKMQGTKEAMELLK
jgi:ankyrin repeat protein